MEESSRLELLRRLAKVSGEAEAAETLNRLIRRLAAEALPQELGPLLSPGQLRLTVLQERIAAAEAGLQTAETAVEVQTAGLRWALARKEAARRGLALAQERRRQAADNLEKLQRMTEALRLALDPPPAPGPQPQQAQEPHPDPFAA